VRRTAVSYEGLGRLIVKGTFEVVLEFVQQHVWIWRRDDGLLARYIAAENLPGRCYALLGLQSAHELHLGLRAEEHAHRAHLVEIGTNRRGRRTSRLTSGAGSESDCGDGVYQERASGHGDQDARQLSCHGGERSRY